MKQPKSSVRAPWSLMRCLAILLFLIVSNGQATTDPAAPIAKLSPESEHSSIALEVLDKLSHGHYEWITLNDEMSSVIFDTYLKGLDARKSYFLASDIAEFEKHRRRFDDLLKEGDVGPAFDIFNRYRERLGERLEFMLSTIDQKLDKFDFEEEEVLEVDRENAPWSATKAELDVLWEKRLKGDVLNLVLTGKDRSEIKKTLKRRYSNQLLRLKQTNPMDVFQTFINASVQAFDPHSAYFPPHQSENFNIYMSLSLEGIGAVLQADGEYVKVLRLVKGGPAEKAGDLQAEDLIVGVGQGTDEEIVDIVGMRLDEVVTLIRGPKATTVRLEIIPEESKTEQRKVIKIVRNKVNLEEQQARKKVIEIKTGDRTRKVGIIQIPTFYADFRAMQAGDPNYKSTTRDVKHLIEELAKENIEGLVVDLRNNGGGSLQEDNGLVGLFIEKGPTVQIRNGRGMVRVNRDPDPTIAYKGPLAVLVNRLSASASEIFAGAIQDYERGLVLGDQTFGKGTVQTLLPVKKGQLKLTQAKFYRVSGESTQHRGVVPHLLLPATIDKSKVGESSLDNALGWDAIESTSHRDFGSVAPLIPALKERHDSRVGNDPDFAYLLARIENLERQRQKTTISLCEPKRQAKKKSDEEWELALENKRRVAKGQITFKSADELEEFNKEQRKNREDAPPEDDALLKEGAYVLSDYIDLTKPTVAVQSEVKGVAHP